MLIWILALVLFAIAGFCGYKLGAVRFAVSLCGLLLGAALAVPVGSYLKPLIPMLGFKNPAWAIVLPPILAFLIIYFVFVGLSFFVHRKVELYYKYNTDDSQRIGWERVNAAVGLWVGLFTGAVWLCLFGLVIYVGGYPAVQLSTDDTQSVWVRFLSQGRKDLATTGLDKAVARFDPMPPRYYEASDILGLIYQNPILISRVTQYPPFLLLGDRSEFQELAKDTEFNQMLLSKADVAQILKHPNFQAIVNNSELLQELLGQDLKDFRTYLETGVSPRYEEEKILGKWRLDPYATMAQERKRHPEMSSSDMRRLKAVMTEIMPAVSVIATTDKKLNLRAEGVADRLQQLFQPAPTAVPAPQAAAPSLSPQLAQRYGRSSAPAPVAAAPSVASQPKPPTIPYMVHSAQGTWEHEGDHYELKLQNDQGKSETLQASADDDRLTISSPNLVLVFAKGE